MESTILLLLEHLAANTQILASSSRQELLQRAAAWISQRPCPQRRCSGALRRSAAGCRGRMAAPACRSRSADGRSPLRRAGGSGGLPCAARRTPAARQPPRTTADRGVGDLCRTLCEMTPCGSGVDAAAPAGGRPVLPPFDVGQESVPLLHGRCAAARLLAPPHLGAIVRRLRRPLCTQRPFVARARRETTHRTPTALPRAVRRHDVRAIERSPLFRCSTMAFVRASPHTPSSIRNSEHRHRPRESSGVRCDGRCGRAAVRAQHQLAARHRSRSALPQGPSLR
jgi:hypothetical protein